MMSSIDEDKTEERVCNVIIDNKGNRKNLSMLVKSQPIILENQRWILVFIQDITKQQFWANMEKFFFHDMNNLLGALAGTSQLAIMKMPDDKRIQNIYAISKRLCNEIGLQKNLWQYKDAQHLTTNTATSVNEIKKELSIILSGHKALKGKYIEENWPEKNVTIHTDIILVTRILSNMIINALEATDKGGTIRISAFIEREHVHWEVWNRNDIPEDLQKRIFQKHFSTKSDIGRGLGTFFMKLIGEEYLKGKISFESSREMGTKFIFMLPY